MKKIDNILIKIFHFINLIFLIFYLYPGSIFGYLLYNDYSIQPQITSNFLISSNHFYAFSLLSIIGVLIYKRVKRIKSLLNYLFFLSIILEILHLFIPNRTFELNDLFGNITGVIVVIIFYKIKLKYE